MKKILATIAILSMGYGLKTEAKLSFAPSMMGIQAGIQSMKGLNNPMITPSFHNIGTDIIYGDDDRYEVDDYPNKSFRELAKSVAGMVKSRHLSDDIGDPTLMNFVKRTSEDKFELCEEEPFAKQYTLPICSGFLIAPDTLVTAGHCIEDQSDCENFKWVFEFKKGTTKIKKENVYSCKKIHERVLKESRFKLKDYAVIQLDRPATGRTPLKFRRKKKARVGTKLVVIGHPSGLPMKITDNGKIQRLNKTEIKRPISSLFKRRYYFNANLDTYSGNSGSPVFNRKTKLVEGVLVQGGDDYVRNIDMFCNESNRLSDSRWVSEESVFRITKVPFIKDIQNKYLKSLEK
ncbi:MAG: V8-like Glu-specific endopeptidase [Bacteriovoracaceae bacterium]|jgi:V8-like Glu-specific endopeptidase